MAVLILGMNDPRGTEALDPRIPFTAGWRLWRLLNARVPVEVDRWRRYSARSNACTGVQWDPAEARDYCRILAAGLDPGYDVLCCGGAVGRLMGAGAPLEWTKGSWGGQVVLLPHPSGKCKWYNDPVCEAAAEIFMEELWWQRIMQIGSPKR